MTLRSLLDAYGEPPTQVTGGDPSSTDVPFSPGESITSAVMKLHSRIAALENADPLKVEMAAAMADRNRELEAQNLELQRALMEANRRILELSERLLESTCQREGAG